MQTPAARPSEWKSTACSPCECNCGIEVQLGGDHGRRLARIRGDDAHPSSRGYACEKAARLDFCQNGPHRLATPLRRRADRTFEEIDWDAAIREVAARFAAVRDAHGGESILYCGGGGQGNHLPGSYSRATRAVLGSRFRSSALAQEKTGEFWVANRMIGGYARGDFAHCEVALFIGKNPWVSHGIARARLTLREISRDPKRCLIVIDPRRSETAELADIHLRVRPGADAFLLAALVAVIVQEGRVADEWLQAHADGAAQVLPHFAHRSVVQYCVRSGVPEGLVRDTASRIARARGISGRVQRALFRASTPGGDRGQRIDPGCGSRLARRHPLAQAHARTAGVSLTCRTATVGTASTAVLELERGANCAVDQGEQCANACPRFSWR